MDFFIRQEPELPEAAPRISLAANASPPGYVPDSDPEEDPKDESKDGHTKYPTDRGDDDDDSSGDDADDEDEGEARIFVRPQTTIPFPSEEEVARLLALSNPLPSPLSPLASPFPQISLLHTSPTYDQAPLGHRAAMILMMRVAAPSTYCLAPPLGTPPLLPIPLPTSSPLLLPFTDHRADVLEAVMPPQKRLCIALGLRFEVGKSSSAARPTGVLEQIMGLLALWMPRLDVTQIGRWVTR
ncbi:hypothetical protein Tco_0412577, partial [Tanacetum coccineum]